MSGRSGGTRARPAALGARDDDAARPARKLRCAVYTRKSSEEGLEQGFNSLDAQREACEAYVASQRSEGWVALPMDYDDGGFSGGTLERPALRRLLADVEAGLVDVVVVYKIDRLSRSLGDFSRLVELFDRTNVTFVSVTQAFNTTSSMGRLTLNILLSFAQFERELTGERIRDKFAASRARGIWMGGWTPLGYDVENRRLLVNEGEAALVRRVFRRFLDLGSATLLARELQAEGARTKQGRPFDKGSLYKLLRNRVYVGEAAHKGVGHPGEHEAIVDRAVFDRVQAVLATNAHQRAATSRRRTPALLKGLLFTAAGRAMAPTHTRKGSKLYRYYVSTDTIRGREVARAGEATAPTRLPADVVETATVREALRLIRSPQVVAQAVGAVQAEAPEVDETEVVAAIERFWDVRGGSDPGRAGAGGPAPGRAGRAARGRSRHHAARSRPWPDRPRDAAAAPRRRAEGGVTGLGASRIVEATGTSVTVIVPLQVRRRNGRPRIIVPAGEGAGEQDAPENGASVAVLRAIARAWGWRRRLEAGEVATLQDVADVEKVTLPFVSRLIRLAYLPPAVLERIVCDRAAVAVSLDQLAAAAVEPWAEQARVVFDVQR